MLMSLTVPAEPERRFVMESAMVHPGTSEWPRDTESTLPVNDQPSTLECRPIDLSDLELWREKGLISRDQVADIRAFVGAQPTEMPTSRVKQRVAGLNFVNIAYYFGGFLVLLAFTFLLGSQWIDAGNEGQIAIAVFAIAIPLSIGMMLRKGEFTTPGNLLIFAATGIVPLLVYTIEKATGFWPGEEKPGHFNDFFEDVLPAWIVMEFVAIAAALVVVWRIRFPLVTLLIAFWTWYLSMDFVRLITEEKDYAWERDTGRILSMLIGAGMIGAGLLLQRRTERDYSLWLYLFGHVTVFCSFSAIALDHQALLGWLVYPLVYLGVVVMSVWLQRKVFLVFGAIGSYCWATYIVFETFHGALGISFGMAFIGIMIVLSGVLYRNSIEPWLQERMSGHRLAI